jgi:hypothetical protein
MPHEYGPRKNFKSGQCVDREGATEERTTAVCLKQLGIKAELGCDSSRRERVIPLGLPFTLTYLRKSNTTGWYWHNKPKTTPDLERCCAPDAWGTHGYKVDIRMRNFHQRLNVEDFNEARKRMGLTSPLPELWSDQERELYDLASTAHDKPVEWFRGQPTTQRLVGQGLERNPRDEWWYTWYALVLRTSLLHNPFYGKIPEPQPVPAGAVEAYRSKSVSYGVALGKLS